MDRFTFYSVYNMVNSPNYKGFDPDKGKKKKKKKEEKKEVKKENKEFDYDTEGILRLRDAIVEQCVKDYRSALKVRNRAKEIELREWFLGDDFAILSASYSIDEARYIVRELRAMVHDELVAEKKEDVIKAKKELAKKKKNKVPYRNLFRKIQNLSAAIRWIEELEDPG